MNPIGGYFELELIRNDNVPIKNGILVNSGRNALEYILLGMLQKDKIETLYIPKFTCEVILEPIKKLGINFKFYSINEELKFNEIPKLRSNDYVLVNNYFGIQDYHINSLIEKLGENLIIDNAHTLYFQTPDNIKAFYSPRKFFGLPDGGIAITPNKLNLNEIDESWDRCSHMLKRIDIGPSEGYYDFRNNSGKLKGIELKQISNLTKSLMSSIDFETNLKKRKINYDFLRTRLEDTNLLRTPSSSDIASPLVYPYKTDSNDLRSKLIKNQIYVATYWPNVFVWCQEQELEFQLAKQVIPLPIDHRYGIEEMSRIVKLITD